MPRNGSGVMSLPAGYLAVTGETITATQHNSPLEDIASEITGSVPRNGAAAMTAALPMGGFKVTGLGAGTAATDAARLSQVQSGVVSQAATVGGTVDAITLIMSPVTTAYTSGEVTRWPSGGFNTVTNPTLNRDGIGTKTIKKGASAALVAGDTGAAGYICEAVYNGTDFILLNPATDAGVKANNAFTGDNSHSGTETFTGPIVIAGPVATPGGRLTLTSASPVLTSDVTAATTVYYTAHVHNFIMLFDGTNWAVKAFSEMSQTLADATKSPAAAAVSSNYDLFVWNDSGTLRCTRGPAWTSSTARGTGAGTTELERLSGVWVNKIAITNGPAAQRGVYVGTISTSASGANGQLNMMFAPAAAAGGSANRLDVWNMYNRVNVASMCRDSTNTWNYTTATWRSSNNNTSNRVTFVMGISEDAVSAEAISLASNSNGVGTAAAVGVDSTSAISGLPGYYRDSTAQTHVMRGIWAGYPGLGSHFVQSLEYSEVGGTTTWEGDNAEPLNRQSGIIMQGMM